MIKHLSEPTHPLSTWLSAYLPPLIWAGVIFVISSQQVLPGPDVFLLDFLFKKSAHMFVYGVLYALLFRSVAMTSPKDKFWLLVTLPLLICLIYAASDELHQSLVTGRYATLRDIGYDMLGVTVVFLKKFAYI